MKTRATLSKCIALSLLSISALATSSVQAQTYAEFGLQSITLKSSDTTAFTASPKVMIANLGYELTPNMAVEATVGGATTDDQIHINGALQATTVSIKNMYGIGVKAMFKPTPKMDVFARVGYMQNNIRVSGGALLDSTSEDVSYGFGANFNITSSTYITANYLNFFNKNNISAEGVTLGLGVRF